MYKNKIKAWKLRKYLTGDEAQEVVDRAGTSSTVDQRPVAAGESAETLKRAVRSLKRKQARRRAISQPSPTVSDITLSLSSPSQASDAVMLWTPSPEALASPDEFRIPETFLFNLRAWTHEAFVAGHWDSNMSHKHHHGRQAARSLTSDLTAGTKLFEKGNEQLAWVYWRRAVGRLQNSSLFNTWYHEIPINLLFHVSRLAHSGHYQLANTLLQSIKDWANVYLKENESRQVLFSVFSDLNVSDLRDLYERAARCFAEGLELRLEKHSPLLNEIRLNRALDMLWFDPEATLTGWLPSMEEIDQFYGPNSSYSIYFLLLQAYRLVAQDSHAEVEQICSQVRDRLMTMDEKSIDSWRIGLAYRRLGRLQQSRHRYKDARRTFNTAYKYVESSSRLSTSILIEICQGQESMAKEMGDQEDAVLWGRILRQLEQQIDDQERADVLQQLQDLSTDSSPVIGRIRPFSPGSGRSLTL